MSSGITFGQTIFFKPSLNFQNAGLGYRSIGREMKDIKTFRTKLVPLMNYTLMLEKTKIVHSVEMGRTAAGIKAMFFNQYNAPGVYAEGYPKFGFSRFNDPLFVSYCLKIKHKSIGLCI